MNENEVKDISGEIVDDAAEMTAEMQAEAAEAAVENSQKEEEGGKETKKLFSLRFKIPLDDYIEFYRVMNVETVAKNKKKTTIMGGVEIVVGLGMAGMMATGNYPASTFSFLLVTAFILFGVYSLTYYKLFYAKSLRRAVEKQYNKIDYLKNDIVLDLYPNKIREHVENRTVETFWHAIHSVKVTPTLFMIMLEPKRCMLIPKSQIAEQEQAMDALNRELCNNFEKPRYEV